MRYLFGIIVFIVCLWGDSTTVFLDDSRSVYDDFEVFYFKDSTNSLDIEEIAKIKFKEKTLSRYALGYSKDTIWFKIKFENRGKKENFILSLNEHFYEKANLHFYENGWQKKENGVFKPLKQREVHSSKLAYNLEISQDSSKTIFLELKAQYPYFGHITVLEKETFFGSQILNIETTFVFVFGVLAIIIIFNLFLWFNLKEKIYIFYVGYTFFTFIYFLNLSGLLVYFDLQYYMFKVHFVSALSVVFLILFSIEYFNTKKYFKLAIKPLKFLALLVLIIGILMLYSYSPWNKFISYSSLVSLISLIVTSFIIYLRGFFFLKYYIIAISIYFISIIVFLFLLIGTIDYNLYTRYGFIFTMSLETVIFALMLANRYNVMKNEQLQTQIQLTDLQNNQNKMLEKEVKSKTENLIGTNQELSKLANERELLVKEVFHRVKNNFHMVSAFLWFESQKEENKERFTELLNRIQSMSLIHEYLCNSKDLVNIDLKEYLNELINTIISTYQNNKINLKTQIEPIIINFDNIINLGAIINEIISNTVKHNEKEKEINLNIYCFKENQNIILKIKDNGKKFEIKEQKIGFGLGLVKNFSKKFPDGRYHFYYDNGMVFELKFKDKKL